MRSKSATNTGSVTDGGVMNVLRVAFPLILASSGHALRLLADRAMLSRYSSEDLAACLPAGLAGFMFMSFFIGTAGYVNTFIAQYTGGSRPGRVGMAVWQGLIIAFAGSLVVALLGEAAGPIFRWMGHDAAVQARQAVYYRILCRLSFGPIVLATLLSFWSGRGRTWMVMKLEILAAALNIILNRLMIFGGLGFPEMGIRGAGLATGLSSVIVSLIAFCLFLGPENRRVYNTGVRNFLNPDIMKRLIRFGSPNGLQFMLDLAAFNFFVALLGRTGFVELQAANIAFGINATAFIPIIGIGMTVSIMVGHCVGAGNIPLAMRAVRSSLVLAVAYSLVMGLFFIVFPQLPLSLFARAGDVSQAEVMAMAGICLRYITAYLFFDAMFITYSHAVKGAGDTRFALAMGVLLSWGTLVLPAWLAWRLGYSAWTLWGILVMHVVIAGTLFYMRYRSGRWKTMKVVETGVVPSESPGTAVAIELDRG